jgi:polar amino acid transport system substrate-binding protein
MKLKTRFAILFLVTFALMSACGRPNSTSGTSQPSASERVQPGTFERVQKSGTLRVGYFVFEPTIMLDPGAEKPRGLFVDLIEDIAHEMRWQVQYVRVDLKNFAAGLQSKDYDLSIGATFSSPSRAGGVSFTEPLFYMGYTGVSTADAAPRFRSWGDIDQPGVRVAVKQGSAIADYVRIHFKKATIISLEAPTLNAPLAAVPGQADVGLMNQITVFTYLRDNPAAAGGHSRLVEILADQPKEFTGICWAVRAEDLRWLAFVNAALKHELDTGRFDDYASRYTIPYMYREKHAYTYRTATGSGDLVR